MIEAAQPEPPLRLPRQLPGEPPAGALLETPGSPAARSDPGGFVHLKPLDGLRGMAICCILLYHMLSASTATGSRVIAFFVMVQQSLWVGVDLFFALSGFLITGILFDALHTRNVLKNFYGRRVVRIFPLYYLVLLVLWLLTKPLGIQWNGQGLYPVLYLANMPRYVLHMSQSLHVAIHLWSLSVEEQFYLIWPFVVLLLRERRRLMMTALVLSAIALALRCVLVAAGAAPDVTYMMLPARMDGLLLGGWLALAIRGPERETVIRRGWMAFAVGAAGFVAIFAWQRGFDHITNPVVNSVGYTFTALGATGLVAMTLLPATRLARAFSAGWLRALGRYSYGIYVWHAVVSDLLLIRLRAFTGEYVDNRLIRLLISSALTIAITILTGVLSYHLFEVHFLRLKRFFAYGK